MLQQRQTVGKQLKQYFTYKSNDLSKWNLAYTLSYNKQLSYQNRMC